MAITPIPLKFSKAAAVAQSFSSDGRIQRSAGGTSNLTFGTPAGSRKRLFGFCYGLSFGMRAAAADFTEERAQLILQDGFGGPTFEDRYIDLVGINGSIENLRYDSPWITLPDSGLALIVGASLNVRLIIGLLSGTAPQNLWADGWINFHGVSEPVP